MSFAIPESFQSCLRAGTCSWKYDSWRGVLYPPERALRADEYLPLYARRLNTVEIDQWFWSLFPAGVKLPDSRAVAAYAAAVPEDFIFTIKAPNAITLTHFYAKQPKRLAAWANRPNRSFLDVDLLKRFLDLLAPLEGKTGPVMFQFEYLNKKKMPSRERFLDHLDAFFERAPAGFQYAVESRNPNYYSPEFFTFLAERKIGFVFLDGYYMPPLDEVLAMRGATAAGVSVIRLHGENRTGIERKTGEIWNRVVSPRDGGLAAAARIVRANRERTLFTFVNVNNHYEGSAPLTIRRFLAELER